MLRIITGLIRRRSDFFPVSWTHSVPMSVVLILASQSYQRIRDGKCSSQAESSPSLLAFHKVVAHQMLNEKMTLFYMPHV